MFASRSSATSKAPAPPPQSIEAVRRRARHRLIGAAVLVLLGVIGFPLLFDTEPRPLSVNIPIEIPSKNPKLGLAVAPVVKEALQSAPAPAKPVETSVAASESLSAREEVVAPEPPRPMQKPAEKPLSLVVEKPTEKPEAAASKAPVKTTPASADAERARALLQGKPAPEKPAPVKSAASAQRLVVQVGAFAEAAGAREVRGKLERAGLKTYTHVAETPQGQRTRVRVGPFDNRADAEKAAARVKALGLPVAILTL
jgi:DedD protein